MTRPRKEHVLHTRISEDLAEDLRRMADELRVPVSNIVRNVLEEAFSVVETVTDNVGDLIEEVVDEAEAAADRIRRRQRRRRRAPRFHAWEEPDEESPDATSPRGASAAAPVDEEVLGWQPLILARDRECDGCGARLARGSQAYAAVGPRGIGSRYVCEGCLHER